MWLLDALGIALIFALIFVLYYLNKSIRVLKGGTGWKLLAIGFSLYAPRVALSYLMDFPILLSWVEVARFLLSVAIIFFLSLGMWKLSADLKKVNIPFFSFVYAKYLVSGVLLFWGSLAVRTASYFFSQLNTPLWWSAARMALLASLLIFGLALRRIYLPFEPKATRPKAGWMKAVEMKWMREDLFMVPLFTLLANGIIVPLLHVDGGIGIANRAVKRCASMHDLLKGNEITEEEGLSADSIFKKAESMNEKERATKLFGAFCCLNSRLIDAYASITSPERAMEAVHDSEEVIEQMHEINLPVDNEMLYKHRIFFGMPDGVAENEKSRTFLYILFKEALEPLLMKCSQETILEVSNLAAAKNIRVEKDGRISLAAIFKEVHEIPPKESIKFTSSLFATVMEDIYPVIRKDLGAERTTGKFSAVFKELFEHQCNIISKYDVLEALPEEIEIPALYKLFKRGNGYLIVEEKPDTSFKLCGKLLEYGFKELIISRTHPSHVHEECSLKDVPVIWLTYAKGENHIVPTNLTQLSIAIKDFVKEEVEGVIMLEGLEYLIDQNGFEVTLRFVESLMDIITMSKSRLIIPFDARTLVEVELHRLEREVNVMSCEELKGII